MGTSGTERGCSWSFVPFQCKNTCLVPCRILALASLNSRNGQVCTCHDSKTILCANWCPRPSSVVSIYIKRDAICSRSIGPFGPPKEEGRRCATLLPLPRYKIHCFSRAALDLIVFHNKSTPIQVANNCPFSSFQWSLWGGLRHALTKVISSRLQSEP